VDYKGYSEMESQYERLKQQARKVLEQNDRGTHTVPSEHMYPHAWLWDSAFISIGLSHVDPKRAASELDFIFDGQWQNGMIPNMRFSPGKQDYRAWNSIRLNHNSPRDIYTSGITQPPIMAEAVQRVAEKLDNEDRLTFTKRSLGRLVAYHEWIYNERNPNNNGLFTAVHPWETGMENTPTWMHHMQSIDWGVSGYLLRGLNAVVQIARRDTKHTPTEQRPNGDEGLLFLQSFMKLRHTHYQRERLEDKYPLHLEDVQLNSILIRNNQVIEELAAEARLQLPDELLAHMAQTRTNIEQLWDPSDQLYYPRDGVTGKPIKIPTIASLMPLYGGSISSEKADALVTHLQNPDSFHLPHGIPTVPHNSPYYRPDCYWSAPTWVNTNWIITEGLRRMNYENLARQIGRSTLATVEKGGLWEYFHPETGQGLGAKNFSWTAGLVLDMCDRYDRRL
jgi:neutral trehalase